MDAETPDGGQAAAAGQAEEVAANWYEDERDRPIDLYTDAARVANNFYGVLIELGMTVPYRGARIVGRLRMSPQHAKLLVLLLTRNLQEYEAGIGQAIPLPREVVERLELLEDDVEEERGA